MADLSLAVVTASTNVERARPCLESWVRHAERPLQLFVVLNGVTPGTAAVIEGALVVSATHPEYLGSVPAFRRGIDLALQGDYDIIANFHDDLELLEDGWDT